jgi:diamine N-acetyltransferase
LGKPHGRKTVAETSTDDEPQQVTLREITGDNLKAVLGLSVAEEQKQVYPRSNAYSIAEALYPPDEDPVWFRAVYAGETPVGFIMTSEVPERGEYFLWRLMIDARHQGKGYGSRAVEALIERIKSNPKAKELVTSYWESNDDAGVFYRRMGFEYTGEVLRGCDRVMRMVFEQKAAM